MNRHPHPRHQNLDLLNHWHWHEFLQVQPEKYIDFEFQEKIIN